MGIPMAVVVNRADIGDRALYDYCRHNLLEILSEIPYSREIAEAYSRGKIISDTSEAHLKLFKDLARKVREMATRPQKLPEKANV